MTAKKTPYFLTIVTTEISDHDPEGYAAYRDELSALVAKQPGFLGATYFAQGKQTLSLTYWESQEAMNQWAASPEHAENKKKSHAGGWLKAVTIEIAQVSHLMEFPPR